MLTELYLFPLKLLLDPGIVDADMGLGLNFSSFITILDCEATIKMSLIFITLLLLI